jgi:hypothetical protein
MTPVKNTAPNKPDLVTVAGRLRRGGDATRSAECTACKRTNRCSPATAG